MSEYLSRKGLMNSLFGGSVAVSAENIAASVEAEAADGVSRPELEKVFYCKLEDFSQLDKASLKQHQEQWSLKPEIDVPGSVRVRCLDKGASYVFTIKNGKNEVEFPASKDGFDAMKAISNNGMIKERFEFPIDTRLFANDEDKKVWEGLKWEVDVYFKEDGSYQEWCKVDLEVPSMEIYKGNERPPFPVEFTKVMTGDRSKLNEEETEFLNSLFDTVFISRNPKAEKDDDQYRNNLMLAHMTAEGNLRFLCRHSMNCYKEMYHD